MTEQRQKAITLQEKKKEEFRDFLAAIQPSSTLELTKEKALCLSEYANEYQTEGLKQRCEEFLILNVPVDLDALRHAITHNLIRRTRQCLDSLGENLGSGS